MEKLYKKFIFCRDASKPSKAPTQLTIFYAGSVCVYDDVTPEKVLIFQAFSDMSIELNM